MRRWLIENGFQGKEGQTVPKMDDEWVTEISNRYIELYEKVTGEKFVKHNALNFNREIEERVSDFLAKL